MKALLISVNPKQAAKILNGEQTVIIKKTMPKCALPIDVYVYCTNSNTEHLFWDWIDPPFVEVNWNILLARGKQIKGTERGYIYNGKVVAKFRLREADEVCIEPFGVEMPEYEETLCSQSCMDLGELVKHLRDGMFGYAYHVSDLQILDEPKELSDLRYWGCLDKVKQAPRTFTYVEGLE